ncbi:MAG: hypothetical protein ACLFPA_10210 [Dichotomicrobium sp.]
MSQNGFDQSPEAETDGPAPETAGGFLAGGGAASGFLAFLGASCCVLPLILVGLGVSTTVIAQLGVLVRLQPWLAGAAVVLVGGGIVAAFWRGRRPGRRTIALLLAAAVFVGLSFLIPIYETGIIRWLNGP